MPSGSQVQLVDLRREVSHQVILCVELLRLAHGPRTEEMDQTRENCILVFLLSAAFKEAAI